MEKDTPTTAYGPRSGQNAWALAGGGGVSPSLLIRRHSEPDPESSRIIRYPLCGASYAGPATPRFTKHRQRQKRRLIYIILSKRTTND